ncbi:DNA processing protein DprA [Clostridia bacterium]|nr:DNA processing protein DprA [Clostridia bacterium]
MAYSEGQKYWIWLASVYGLGAKRFDTLVRHCGPPQRIWEEAGDWMENIIGRAAFTALLEARSARYLDELFAQIEACGAVAVTREDDEYPAGLRTIPDPPPVLFVRGRAALSEPRALAIVGARNCSAYGTRMARTIARSLSCAGVTVVSGLARGIDGAAHRGAVDMHARTVAVLGSGVDVLYPAEHQTLAREILDNGGSIVSELRPGTPPTPRHFPARNRIISGLSDGVLLVEGAKRSGAMTTITFAVEQGRDVLALPGQADSPLSAATHTLIREGARLVTGAADILEDMKWPCAATPPPLRTAALLPLTQGEQRVWNALAGGPVDGDALLEAAGLPPPELNSLLTIMELQGLIKKLPGRKIERNAMLEE